MKKTLALLLAALMLCSLIPAAFAESEAPYQVLNGDFETGDLTGWTVPDNWGRDENGNPTGVISAETYWAEEMPYNQGGNYHLDGWYNGIPEPETWAIRSSNFILGGCGYITARMGGNAAALRVYRASDDAEVGYFAQRRFKDSGFPSLKNGGSWADMATYVMDLSEFLGEELYIVLCDQETNTWAQAFFDEVITYYEEIPDYKAHVDVVKDGGSSDLVEIKWQRTINLAMPIL